MQAKPVVAVTKEGNNKCYMLLVIGFNAHGEVENATKEDDWEWQHS
jgi:hypothetical protein